MEFCDLSLKHGILLFLLRYLTIFISPPNSYMHRKREVPGRNSGFTAGNQFRAVKYSIYCPELKMLISNLLFDQFSLKKKEIYLKSELASIVGIRKGV